MYLWLWKEICWKTAALLKQIKKCYFKHPEAVAWDSEYLLCSLVCISCFIINVLLKIMNYEFLYSFLLEQITSMYALRRYRKSPAAAMDCFLLSNQQCLTTQSHFSCTIILIIIILFNSSPIARKIYAFSPFTLIITILPQGKKYFSGDIMLYMIL